MTDIAGMGERERRAMEVLRLKSEKNKVGVPADRRFLSPEQNSAFELTEADKP